MILEQKKKLKEMNLIKINDSTVRSSCLHNLLADEEIVAFKNIPVEKSLFAEAKATENVDQSL